MCTSEQASAEKRLGLQPKAIDSDERRRRLRKVYDILLALAEQAEATSLESLCDQPQPAD